MKRQVEFQAPSDVVFSYIHEPEKRTLWMTDIVSERVVEGTPEGVGHVSIMTLREGGKSTDCRIETTAYEPPSHVAIQMTGGNFGPWS